MKNSKSLSQTPSAIARRFQRATETQVEKKARLAKRYAGLARFNNMQIGYASTVAQRREDAARAANYAANHVRASLA